MNTMQAKIKDILAKYGHDVLLQRRVMTSIGETSYPNPPERHTVRFSVYNNRGLANVQQELLEGLVNTSTRVYYFLHDVNP
jgi:hypothetical protein